MKRSRFFCEHCHHEVRASAKVCPQCGRFFESVRCPACTYVGQGHDFLNGCPNCGYAGGSPDGRGGRGGFDPVDYGASPPRRKPDTPAWVWPLAMGILLVAFLGLVVIYLRL